MNNLLNFQTQNPLHAKNEYLHFHRSRHSIKMLCNAYERRPSTEPATPWRVRWRAKLRSRRENIEISEENLKKFQVSSSTLTHHVSMHKHEFNIFHFSHIFKSNSKSPWQSDRSSSHSFFMSVQHSTIFTRMVWRIEGWTKGGNSTFFILWNVNVGFCSFASFGCRPTRNGGEEIESAQIQYSLTFWIILVKWTRHEKERRKVRKLKVGLESRYEWKTKKSSSCWAFTCLH